MKGNGKTITCMGRGHINGETGVRMWEITCKTRSMDMEYIPGRMGGSMTAAGQMGNRMGEG